MLSLFLQVLPVTTKSVSVEGSVEKQVSTEEDVTTKETLERYSEL